MEQHGLLQKDLTDIFGTPSIVSEVLSGKRELNTRITSGDWLRGSVFRPSCFSNV
jgi:hypothetical protein